MIEKQYGGLATGLGLTSPTQEKARNGFSREVAEQEKIVAELHQQVDGLANLLDPILFVSPSDPGVATQRTEPVFCSLGRAIHNNNDALRTLAKKIEAIARAVNL